MQHRWDIDDPEPAHVGHVHDLIAEDEDDDSAHWGRTELGEWKGYKNGGKVYLDWPELVRRWGPVERREDC
jgi:diadenosine tetraphosphatase ApaH/serine/threonine PP2A family protein phosphatase